MIEDLVRRINSAEQRIKIEQFDIAQAERQLEAFVRANPGTPIPPGILEGLVPEAEHRVLPRLSLNGRFSYTGTT